MGRLKDLLELFRRHFWCFDSLMEASWSFVEAPWAAKTIFERFGSDFDSQNGVQFGPQILKIGEKTIKKASKSFTCF